MSMLELTGVTKKFGGIVACKDISFSVAPGQVAGLIGPNGAGKTTVFNLITGVYAPTAGSITFADQDITAIRPDKVVAHGIARTFQNIRLFRNLTVLDNVRIAVDKEVDYALGEALVRSPRVKNLEQEICALAMERLEEVGLADKADVRADSLPYGLQRKLEIARALALRPRLLLLDEPAAGMNPEESLELAGLVRTLHARHDLTILLIEHHMDVVMELCERIFVLDFGVKLAEGTAEEIQTNPDVLRAYLGEGYKRVRSQ
ncbi:ABC transporter ATP-binding protein [Anaeroselena agilis]|uniref:ABC transporter ATP-binding protein n=1 Tax=Anaeroselena agilis TaxID=3063788 RepID=A0ABU3P315_9FIRM|nr:ABC transporter ATP-binding protein [Selenomonadales bacterium 4137-cl]